MPEDRDYAALLSAYRTALLTTRGGDGHLHCRPMAMRQQVRGEEIWFATELRSNKCRDLAADPRCVLAFYDAADGTTLSVSGRGEVMSDRKLVLALWDPSWARWFPGGPAQRGIALVRVIPERVERHDGRTGKVEVLYAAGRGRGPRRVGSRWRLEDGSPVRGSRGRRPLHGMKNTPFRSSVCASGFPAPSSAMTRSW